MFCISENKTLSAKKSFATYHNTLFQSTDASVTAPNVLYHWSLDTESSDSGVGMLDDDSRSVEVSFVMDGAADGVRERFCFRSDLRVRFGFLADFSSSDFSGLASMNSRILSRSSLPR